ncbi:hypothetical protein OCOL_000637 [Ordospora colligata]|uniref:Uncharacterized protein n=1 Tax=Ordospora colligata OC4 TaxID=1354746 RepID=A0A0B2UMK0_9MICR|nr:uncharacterized protein M896_011790 [Ordospora colligata OC4]KHN70524.1 hypothetical protein M896_011790 [Ordospora colligata OC4]TBU17274.1 hypothetical protein CWI41_011790 [Ordospora colligata]TBU17524.1 hypothetical protein CWI40_011790 [Ordospora colligata]
MDHFSHASPKSFDLGKKGFLRYEEYKGYCLSIFKQPLDKNNIGDRISFDQIRFTEGEAHIDAVFEFFSQGQQHISLQTLRDAVSKLDLNITDPEMEGMIDLLSVNGLISKNEFSHAFG